jgi:hypothetical protein
MRAMQAIISFGGVAGFVRRWYASTMALLKNSKELFSLTEVQT